MPKILHQWISILLTFGFFLFSLVLFRSNSITDAWGYYKQMFSASLFTMPNILSPKFRLIYLLLTIVAFISIEWISKNKPHVLEIRHLSTFKRWSIYLTLILVIIFFGRFNSNDFIYFQF